MAEIMDGISCSRDRGEAPLFGDTDGCDPWLWFLFVVVLAFLWVRILHYMGRVPFAE